MIGPNLVAASAARTTTGTSGTMEIKTGSGGGGKAVGDGALTLGLSITAASGTTPTLDLTVEWSYDGGVTFLVGEPADSFSQKTGVSTAAKSFTPKGNAYRVKWTIAGTTPSFTFSVNETQL